MTYFLLMVGDVYYPDPLDVQKVLFNTQTEAEQAGEQAVGNDKYRYFEVIQVELPE